jgi:hypothetical protein
LPIPGGSSVPRANTTSMSGQWLPAVGTTGKATIAATKTTVAKATVATRAARRTGMAHVTGAALQDTGLSST